jgi:hypothetical protein
MRRQPHVPVLEQSLQRKPRQIGRRKTGLHSQSFKLRTLRRRQAKLKTCGVGHAHMRRQSAAGGNALRWGCAWWQNIPRLQHNRAADFH